MIEYLRYTKLHHKQVAQMDELIIELKAKQKALNEQAKIIRNSEKSQRNRLNTIYFDIFETADKYFTCH